jgi:hypothetical protein
MGQMLRIGGTAMAMVETMRVMRRLKEIQTTYLKKVDVKAMTIIVMQTKDVGQMM